MLKYLGTVLILMGIFMIFYGMFFSMQIFLQEKEPPSVFKTENIFLGDLIPKVEEGSEELKQEEVDIESIIPISDTLNVFAALSFAALLVFGGARIASVGVSILK
jgi:hypothetical protein